MSRNRPPSTRPKPAIEPDPQGQILEALHGAGARGLTKSALVGVPARKGFSPALAQLLKTRRAVNLGDAKSPRYVLPPHDRRREEARAAIEKLAASPGGPLVAFTRAALRGGKRGAAAKIMDEVAAELVAERRLLPVRAGRSTLFLHAAAVASCLLPPVTTAGPSAGKTTAPPAAPEFSPDAVRAAYAALARERGLSDVPIFELQRRSAAPLGALQAWLREESRAGRAVPSRGDWALVGESERAAAIEIRGEPHLRVRLTEMTHDQ